MPVAPNFRFFATVLLLTSTGLFLRIRTVDEVIPPRQSLASFPQQFGTWMGTDVSISPDVVRVLGPGDFLFRNYEDTSHSASAVNIFAAYFPTQRVGATIHSPKNCLPGAGWQPLDSTRITLFVPGRAPIVVNRYLVGKGSTRALVLYWYWAHNRAVANEYLAKFYLIEDSIRMNRSDGSLIRATTEIQKSESIADAQLRLTSLLQQMIPRLDAYIPR